MAKYICPYCIEEHSFSEVEFRCENINPNECPEENDIPYLKYLGMDAESVLLKRKTFPGREKLPKFIKNKYMQVFETCPNCNKKSTTRICPGCHNELPKDVDKNRTLIIAVVGNRDVGKTHFLAVLLNRFREICTNDLNGTFVPMNREIDAHFKENFYRKLYEEQTLHNLTLTANMAGENVVRKPLIFEMMLPGGKKVQKYTVIFYDAAGEDLQDDLVMRTSNKYICQASGIIMLLDPMQLPEMKLKLENNMENSSSIHEGEIKDQVMVLTTIADMIRRDRSMSSEKPINIPIAVSLTKSDVTESLFAKPFVTKDRKGTEMEVDPTILLSASDLLKAGKFDEGKRQDASKAVKGVLDSCGGKAKEISINTEMNYEKYTYCALSALGQQPIAEGGVKKIKNKPMPHRVEDPLLWILRENGILENA